MAVFGRGGHSFCPRRASFRLVNERLVADPEAWPFRSPECGVLTCPYCIETALWKWTVSFEHAAPERFAVFTQLSGDWELDRVAIKSLHLSIRRGSIPGRPKVANSPGFEYVDPQGRTRYFTGADIESAYTVEAGARTGMVHLNLFWHGGFVPQAFLVAVAESLGWGSRVSVNKWQPVRRNSSGYGMKEARSASGYGMKEAKSQAKSDDKSELLIDKLEPGQAAFLARNGGRLMHTTRGFFRSGPKGEPLGTQREAFRSAMRAADIEQGRMPPVEGESSWVEYGPTRDVIVWHSPGCGNDRSVLVTQPERSGVPTSVGLPQSSSLSVGDQLDLRLAYST